MKAKYLFYSLALASTFAACTQDELFEAPALESNDVAGRPVAGVVTFVNDDVESRYNAEKAQFENGDQMGLYLMDEFRGWGEADNANETLWQWQSCWWNMYNMVDYISTNYGYVYNDENEEWINRASQLVEGNYIAMLPQNTRATNRRDLWHPINANVKLEDHSSKPRYYVNRENQFFLGYEQILRDTKAGEETGELRASISMKPILTYQKFEFINEGSYNFKPKKVVFKAHGGKTLPNVAYVKPSKIVRTAYEGGCDVAWSAPWWAWGNLDAMKETLEDECGDLLAWNKYDRTTYNHQAARSLVQYASTADGHIPYGMTEAEAVPTYEYVFNFPADADIIYGNIEAAENGGVSATKSTISIALPMFEGWQNMEMVVYGEMQTADDTYRPGVLRKRTDVDNGKFQYNLREWNQSMGTNIPMSSVTFDTNYFYQQEEVRVATTEDLINLLTARLSDTYTGETSIDFDVYYYGNGVRITKEVVDLVKNYEAKNTNVDVTVTFKNTDRVKTPIIFETDAIDMFEYRGVYVEVEAPQTITDAIVDGITELRNFSKINLVDNTETTMVPTALVATTIVNEVGATFVAEDASIETTELHNEGTLTLSDTTIEGKVSNAATMTVTGEDMTSITTILNDNNCINCGKDEAVLTIESGALYVEEELTNYDKVVVESGAELQGVIINNGTMDVKGYVFLAGLNSADAVINIAATGEVRANIFNDGITANPFLNLGTINVEGELVENIYNSGVIYVKNSGHVIVAGKVEGGVDGIIDVTAAANDNTARAAKDMSFKNYFRYTVGTETTATALQTSLKARISSQNWGKGGSPIILVWGENSATTYAGTMTEANVERIIVENNLTIVEKEGTTTVETKFDELNDYDWTTTPQPANKALWVVSGASLTVDNFATLTLKERTYEVTNQIDKENGTLHVRIDGKFMAKNHSTVNDKNVVVAGLGTVEIDTADSNFFWTQEVGEWLGNWDGK